MQKITSIFLILIATCHASSASDIHLTKKRTLASAPSTKEMAQKKLEEVFNLVNDPDGNGLTHLPYAVSPLERRGQAATGGGFWDVFVEDSYYDLPKKDRSRLICFGPGEYVLPHSHDVHEFFTIAAGACTVARKLDGIWRFMKYNSSSDTKRFTIAAGIVHCLIAHEDGLCMETDDDKARLVIPASEEMPDFPVDTNSEI